MSSNGSSRTDAVPDRAPMTFGQLSVWRSISGHGHTVPADAMMVREWEYPGADEGALVAALEALEERHESLRTCYDVSGLEQVVLPARTADEARVEVADVAAQRLDPEHDHPWAYAVHRPSAAGPWVVTAAIHHIAADGWGTDVMAEDLRRHLTDGGWADPAPQPRELAARQRRSRRDAEPLLRHWRAALEGQEPYPGTPAEAGADHVQVESYDALRDAMRLREEHGVSIHAVTLLILLRMIGARGERPLVTMIGSNRHSPRWHGLVSSMNQIAPLAMTPGGDVAEDLRRLQAESLRAYRHAMFDVDLLEEELADTGFNGTGQGFAHFFNYAELATPRVPEASGGGWEVLREERHAGFPLYARVDVTDALRYALKQPGDYLAADPEDLAREIVDSLRAWASD